MTDRPTASTITDDQLDALYAERDQLASLAVNAANALRDEKRHYRIACEENARLAAVVRRLDQMADAWEQRLPETIRTPAVVSAIRAATDRAALTPAVPSEADNTQKGSTP